MSIIAIVGLVFLCMLILGLVSIAVCFAGLGDYLPDFIITIIKVLVIVGLSGLLISGIVAIFLYLPC